MSGRDITEGRSTRAIAVDLGIAGGNLWQNTGDSYDVAIGGVPFLLNVSDKLPYERATAPFRKQQFDSQRDPGEQSLSSWWIRSQSSFHTGEGIYFYDPFANPYSTTLASNAYRIRNAYGVNIWEPGQVTLLKDVIEGHNITGQIRTNGRSNQHIRSVQWNGINGVLLHDEYDIDRIHADGTVDHWVDQAAGQDKVYTLTDDGTTAYWITNAATSGKLEFLKKNISAATSTAATSMFTTPGITVTNAVIEYVKQRLVACVNNAVYEMPTSAAALPTAIYTHPNTGYVFTSIAESGAAIYISGYSGLKSSILKFTLDTAGAMPTLTSGWVAAEFPVGEKVHKIYGYLGYLMIGTNKGIRVAQVNSDGSLTYGPLIVETTHPCYDFAARDTFVWCATGVEVLNVEPGVIRINLGQEIDTLRFAYAKDLHADATAHTETTACGFFGDTDRLTFCNAATSTANGHIYYEHATNYVASGYLETGFIRMNTLEPKHFKRIVGQGDFSVGSMSLATVALDGNVYDVNSYDAVIGNPESTITQPTGPQDAMGLRFTLYHAASDATKTPIFKGYQLKTVPASPRNRIIKVPLLNFDTETDKYNTTLGWEGRAFERLTALESIERNGDVVAYQDFRTNEIYQCLIEEVAFINNTPPDKKLTNFGGTIIVTLRTV